MDLLIDQLFQHHSLQRIHWQTGDLVLHFNGMRARTLSTFLLFWVNYSFKLWKRECILNIEKHTL